MMLNRFLGEPVVLNVSQASQVEEGASEDRALPSLICSWNPCGTRCQTSVPWTRCEGFELGPEGERECIHLSNTMH